MKLCFTRKCSSYLFGLIIPYVNALLLLQLLAEKGSFQAVLSMLMNPKVCFPGFYTWDSTPSSCVWPWITTAESPHLAETKSIDDKQVSCCDKDWCEFSVCCKTTMGLVREIRCAFAKHGRNAWGSWFNFLVIVIQNVSRRFSSVFSSHTQEPAAPGVLDLAHPCSITHQSRALLTHVCHRHKPWLQHLVHCCFCEFSSEFCEFCVNCYLYNPILVPSICSRGYFCLMSICGVI